MSTRDSELQCTAVDWCRLTAGALWCKLLLVFWCKPTAGTLHWSNIHQLAHLPMSQNTFCIVTLSKPSETSTYQLQQQQECVKTFLLLLDSNLRPTPSTLVSVVTETWVEN